jgi:ligand-binding sensor domain-containing protein
MHSTFLCKTTMRKWLLILILLSLHIYISTLWAQDMETIAAQPIDLWRIYRYADGLADNMVFDIFQDKDGVLWIGTGAGASRFDGVDWRTYPPEDGALQQFVWDMEQDRDGAIWALTVAGIYGESPRVSRFGGKQWRILTAADGLANDTVNRIFRDREGGMWVATDGGVSRFDGEKWASYTETDGLIDNGVRCIAQDTEGAYWFGTDGGVSQFDGEQWISYSQEDGLAFAPVQFIFPDKDGGIWFGKGAAPGESEDRASYFDGKNWTTYALPLSKVSKIMQDRGGGLWFVGGFGDRNGTSYFSGRQWKQYTVRNGLGHNTVSDILEDDKGDLWFGTGWVYTGDVSEPLGGVSRFDGRRWINYTEKDGLAGHMTLKVFQDREGILWFGDIMNGLTRLDRQSWVRYVPRNDRPPGAENPVVRRVFSTIQSQDGALWFATGGWGVYRYDGENWTRFTDKEGLAQNDIRCVLQDQDGVFWFGTYMRGLNSFDGTRWRTYATEDGLANMFIRCIFQGRDGVLWFGTMNGVSSFDGESWKSYSPGENSLAGELVPAIFQDRDGAFWFVTNGGISRFDSSNWQTFPHQGTGGMEPFGAIYQDSDGVLWFGGMKGLSRFDGRMWKTYTVSDGLSDNYVTAITQDQSGTLWIGTLRGGVSRFDGRTFQTLDTRDGLPNDKIGSLFIDNESQVWIGTEDDLVSYTPSKVPPTVSVTRILADEKAYENPTDTLKLESGISRVSFSFRGVSFRTFPGKMLYYYQLARKDADWQGPTNQEIVEYFNLKHGKYTFKVQAVDRDLNYSEPASLEVRIPATPFYTNAGFITSSILLILLIPTGIYALALARQKKPPFEPISNPYIVGNPIRSREMFFGRKTDFEFIRMKLSTRESGLVIVFAGARRSGKTSILFQILNGELGERFVPVRIDMQSMTVDSEAEFLERIASGISEALVKIRLEPVSAAFQEGNPTRVFQELIAQTMEKLEGKGVLLLFDEYELIEARIDDGVLRPDIITFFAGILEAHPRISFIFTGSRHLEQRNQAYWNILIGKSLYRHISFLSERDALRLITEPVARQAVYPRGIPQRIVRLTAGHPFYTQVVCQNLIDRLNEVERNSVRQEDLEAVAQELADNPLPHMIYFWDGLEQRQQNALSLLGDVLEDPIGYASAEMLLEFAQEQNLKIELDTSELRRILDGLLVDEVLERERSEESQYEYRFRVDLFRLWVRQAHSVWRTP